MLAQKKTKSGSYFAVRPNFFISIQFNTVKTEMTTFFKMKVLVFKCS